jgi:TetR/AcrR family transcriptional regulator, regulator of autoinduction and epiphytic fitness
VTEQLSVEQTIDDAATDRRTALKARHRGDILDAARSLIAERGGPAFSVDELAERADVSRRTIFNHFASLDDVVLTVCTEVLDVVVERFAEAAAATRVGDGSRSAMFDELAHTLKAADLAGSIATLGRMLGGGAVDDVRAQQVTQDAFAQTGGRLSRYVEAHNPGADPLDVELLVSSLLGGVSVIAKHWLISTGGRMDAAARADWDALLDRLIHSVRSGYLPA